MQDVPFLGVGTLRYFGGELEERGNPFVLQARILFRKIAIGLGMPRYMDVSIAQNVVGKQILRIAAGPCSHRPEENPDPFGDLGRNLGRNHLDLDRKGARSLVTANLVVKPQCRFGGLANRTEPASPGRPRWHEPHVTNNRNVFAGEIFDGLQRARTINRVGAPVDRATRPTEVVLGCPGFQMRHPGHREDRRRHLPVVRVPNDLGRDRSDVDPDGLRRCGLVEAEGAQHRQLPLALLSAQIVDHWQPAGRAHETALSGTAPCSEAR